MSIFSKIFRGTVANDNTGDPLRTGGQIVNDNFDITEAALLDRLLRVDSVENIAGLAGDYDGQQISLLGWHPDSDIGGGVLYWDPAKAKSDHNGGTVFSPTVPWSANIGDYLDGVGETDGSGFGCWVRLFDQGEIHSVWFGGNMDLPLSVESAYKVAGNAAAENGASKVIISSGVFEVSRPIWIYQRDGVRLCGAGRWATQIKISPTFNGDAGRPAEFDAIEGALGFTYVGQRAIFMIAARRVTGGANGDLNPSGANANAWSLGFQGFTVLDPNRDMDTDVFYSPRIAHSEITDIYCDGVKRFMWADDFYRGEMHHIDIFNCYMPLEVLGGTTLHLSNIGASYSVYGYKLYAQYSQYDNLAIDHWGQGQDGTIESYAYDLKGVGVTLDGCGCEYGTGGVLRMSNRPSTNITFNGGMFIGGGTQEDGSRFDWTGQSSNSDFGVPNGLVYINDARVSFNGTSIRLLVNKNGDPLQGFEKLKMNVNGISYVTINNLGGQEVTDSLIKTKWTQITDITSNNSSTVSVLDGYSKPVLSIHTNADATIPSNNFGYNFSGYKVDNLDLWDDTTGSYTIPVSGYYKINMDVHGESAGINYISANVTGRPVADLQALCDAGNTHPIVNLNRMVYLWGGEIITFSIRTNTGTSVLLKKGSGISISMI